MRAIVVLLDGLGDRPSSILNNKTPLEYANTPNLDKLSEKAMTGLMIPYKEGVPLGTEVAHFLLWGYNIEDFPGRGVIEALGEDVEMDHNSIYLRATFGFVKKDEDGLCVIDRRTKDITIDEIEKLVDSIPNFVDGYEFELKYSYDVHFILKIKEENGWISDKISDSDPFYRNRHVMKVFPIKELCNSRIEFDKAKSTAEALNKYLLKCHQILENHDVNIKRKRREKQSANFLLTKWAGKYPESQGLNDSNSTSFHSENKEIPSFKEKWGMKGVVIANSSVFKGLAKLLKMDYIAADSFEEAIKIGIDLKDYDFIHIHTKDIDESSHKKDPMKVVKVIEEIDSYLSPILDLKEDLVVITADHSTPSVGTLIHSGESVPIAIVGSNVRTDDVKRFNERECSKGHLRIFSNDLMNIILNYTDRALLHGLRSGNKIIRYIPDDDDVEHLK
ncbi:alkaline phosphatase family protein [Methanothermococcus thermolithotrophicus]|jgi:2,3-bisphosphoglycerate-independent phosphoglycerate mutase|uniref:alkaline phosphatase family protein n=1 Tax=Methanothermococcus thermolithotrophicus TaxID=2186 RepID=UPI00037335AC|nr:2,3-bisphosphoglycerate-independent phosphoglycerate mutase [Methanothermococcus thermolithotrophicus]MDK2988121.1 2,3-bisphosphoglycerate-independent phosphoglycerate mutase [Methanothermococcus sp.]